MDISSPVVDLNDAWFGIVTRPFILSLALQDLKAQVNGRSARRRGLKEAESFRAVAYQQVLGLLIVIEHHPMVFAAKSRLLIAAKRRVRRIEVVAIGPDASGLDGAAEAIGGVDASCPHASAKPIEGIIGNR